MSCRVRDVSLVHPAILMKDNDVRQAANSSAASNYVQRQEQEHFDRDKVDRHIIINKLFAMCACWFVRVCVCMSVCRTSTTSDPRN